MDNAHATSQLSLEPPDDDEGVNQERRVAEQRRQEGFAFTSASDDDVRVAAGQYEIHQVSMIYPVD